MDLLMIRLLMACNFFVLLGFSTVVLAANVVAENAHRQLLKAPDPFAKVSEVAAWAEQADTLGSVTEKDFKPHDKSLKLVSLGKLGAQVSESCFRGMSAADRAETLKVFERGLAHALAQVGRCYSEFRFQELSGLVSILRRLVISCEQMNPAFGAYVQEGQFGLKLFNSRKTVLSSFLHVWPVKYNAKNFNKGADPARIGAALFHEALHYTPANHREWHGEVGVTKGQFGCQNTRYEDRMFFITATCHPNDPDGVLFLTGADHTAEKTKLGPAAQCKNVCEAALGPAQLREGKDCHYCGGTGGVTELISKKFIGAPLVALPYPKSQIESTCAKVRAYSQRRRDYLDAWVKVTRMSQTLRNPTDFPNNGSMYGIANLYDGALLELNGLVASGPSKARLGGFAAAIKKVKDEITRGCGLATKPDRWRWLCENNGTPVLDALDRMERLADDVAKAKLEPLFALPTLN